MDALVKVRVAEFEVPERIAINPEGMLSAGDPASSVPLNALDAKTLDRMCKEFRKAVFRKALQKDPSNIKVSRPYPIKQTRYVVGDEGPDAPEEVAND